MSPQSITDNIANVRARIRSTEQSAGRAADSVTLMAVSKTRGAEEIRDAYRAGIRQIGENYLQEALAKQQLLADCKELCWHFIGPLQSNKTRAVAEHFDWIHSVDRIKLARRLSEQRPESMPALNVCLQVNISNEASKAGVGLAELHELADEVAKLPGLKLRGLMAIPEKTDDSTQQHNAFARLRAALQELQAQHPDLDTLSMGMSADMEAAIAEGATIVRIGTDIFGPRRHSNER